MGDDVVPIGCLLVGYLLDGSAQAIKITYAYNSILRVVDIYGALCGRFFIGGGFYVVLGGALRMQAVKSEK